MRDKICQFKIYQPLTPGRREALNNYLEEREDISIESYSWDSEDAWHIVTQPVEWEVRFTTHRVTVFGTAPSWAWLLLTDSTRERIRDEIREGLKQAGFLDRKEESEKVESSLAVE
jgi:hypothetical protein